MEDTLDSKIGQKTILLVDDEDSILQHLSELLIASKYNVIASRNGKEAIERSLHFEGDIHLLLSDFDMPEMSGIELATALTLTRPKIKVLMMSGFTGGMLVLNEGWHFLPRPFIQSQLLALIAGLVTPDRPSRFVN